MNRKAMGIVGLAGAALLLGAVSGAWAKGPGHEGWGRGPGGGHGPGMIQALNLTEEQTTKLQQDRLARQKRMIQLRAEMKTLRVDLQAEATATKPDRSKIQTLTRKLGDVHGKLAQERIEGMLFLRGILTPEQAKIYENAPMGHGPWGGDRGDGPGGFGPGDGPGDGPGSCR